MTQPVPLLIARHGARRGILGTTALAVLAVWTLARPVAAESPYCDEALVPQPAECSRSNADVVVTMPMGENTEVPATPSGTGFDTLGFSISIGDKTVAGAVAPPVPQRSADIDAADAGVQVRFDGLDLHPILNVTTSDLRAAYRAGETIRFRASSNYPAFISRAEVLVTDRSRRGAPVVARIPIQPNGEAAWAMPPDGDGEYAYVLRVYDARGRHDETRALDLDRTTAAFATHEMTGPVIAAGEGEDRTAKRGIPVEGGTITANGTGLAGLRAVTVIGEQVPVDPSGSFVVQRILPPGDHAVSVDVGGRPVVREISIPKAEWFYVAIADITAGKRLQDDLADATGEYDETYVDGRVAYYLKGKVKGKYLITSSLDTGEGPLDEMFSRLDKKDPRRVLDRLDPEDFYPVYGDDSSAYDDTPTSGRFYVRIDRGASHAIWGDFRAGIDGARLLRNDRSLYGAKLHFATPSVTEKGDARVTATLYAAQPDTLPQRDILRGTGGSVFFLSRQDLNAGSESVAVQLRDPDTGRVVETRVLVEGVDYDIDYMQGVLILTQPLPSSSSGGQLISQGPSGSLDVNLVVQYEYTPLTGSLEGAAVGGRLEFWATDDLRVGITAMRETTGPADQRMAGADLRWNLGESSFIEAEVAESDGPGFGRSISTDGGLTLTPEGIAGSGRARAYRFDSQLDLADLGLAVPGRLQLWYEGKEKGFSTINEDITEDQRLFGLSADVDVSARLSLGITLENFERDGGDKKDTAEVRLTYALSDTWSVEAGVARLDRFTVGDADKTGKRTDAAVRLNYRPSDDLLVYGFAQKTLSVSGGIGDNDRVGLGFDARLTEKVSVLAEASDGDKGVGAKARLTYSPTADNEVYIGYTLDPTRTGAGYDLVGRDDGTFVVGGRFRQSDTLLTWGENSWDMFGARRSLTRGYGVTYTPDARWSVSAGFESGEVRDDVNGDFDRTAISLGAAYAADDAVKGRARLEYRTENGDGIAQDRKTWGFTGGYEYKVSDDWRFLANVDALYSDSAESDFRDGEYVEASLGYAYRPVDNDRLNLLMKYTYLRDLPGENQVTIDGTTDGPLQISNIFSIDGNYDLSPKLTLGAKYGYRHGQVAPRGTEIFSDSTAQLGIVRLDWHVVHKWDLLAEGRMLYTREIDTTEEGALLALYRHLGNNAKLGLGYEWGRVSDNPASIDYVARGVFLNLIAKF